MATRQSFTEGDENRDLITGEPGSHPVGVGVGAAIGGAAAGAAAGMMAGPVGTVSGAVVGGVLGGLAGKDVAEQIDPSIEEHHWRNEYPMRSYYDPTIGYEEIGPAYQYGWESRAEYGDRKWDEVEADLAHDWSNRRDKSSLDWSRARSAARDAWERVNTKFGSDANDSTHSDPMEDSGVAAPRVPK